MSDLPGTVVSFYSYKGGVGRTMAVVNVAMTLAQNGFRVLVVDLDLLAPGVQDFPRFRQAVESSNRYTRPNDRELGQGGFLDLVERQLWTSPQCDADRQPFRDALRPVDASTEIWQKWMRKVYSHSASSGKVDVIPAGPSDHRAIEILAQIGWYRFLTEFDGLKLILSMRDQWWRKEYDFTLVDSRTGLSDYLQFCVGMLPDVAILIAGLNQQNIDGLRAALSGIEEVLPPRKSLLYVIPVLSLVPSGELDKVQERFCYANKVLHTVKKSEDASSGSLLRFLGEPVRLPYVATLAVEERLIVPGDDHAPIFRSYVKIAEMLARHRSAEIDNLFDEAIYEGAATGLKNRDIIATLNEARKASFETRYMYGRIRCELLDAQRLAFDRKIPASLKGFEKAVALIRERHRFEEGKTWKDADPPMGHWQIELDTLVFYARVLAVNHSKEAVLAFTDALKFVAAFEKRNHADVFSDRDWDRYSHELLFTRAFCHLGLLEARIKERKKRPVVPARTLQADLDEAKNLFDQLMPNGISAGIKLRLARAAHVVEKLR